MGQFKRYSVAFIAVVLMLLIALEASLADTCSSYLNGRMHGVIDTFRCKHWYHWLMVW